MEIEVKTQRGLDCVNLICAADEYLCRVKYYGAEQLRERQQRKEFEEAEPAGNA